MSAVLETAEELLRNGQPEQALEALQAQVRQSPGDAKLRVFLFQLLAVVGDWKRAASQLDVAAELDASALAMAQMYREAIRCEALRSAVFAGRHTPVVFGEPAEWVGWLVEALRLIANNEFQAAATLRDQAFEAAPAISGAVNDDPFEWIADADSRLGPVVELVVNGRYGWAPLEHIARLDFEPPADLRDLVWAPVQITWSNGGQVVAVTPSRYVGSESDSDPSVQLCRKTTWNELPSNTFLGVGQRMLATNVADYPILEIRSIQLNCPESAADSEPGDVG